MGKIKAKKKLAIVSAIFLAVIFVICVGIFIWESLNSDIKIGNVTITKKQIEQYAKDYKEYYNEVSEKEAKEKATDILVMNAALRDYASKCNVDASIVDNESDVLSYAGVGKDVYNEYKPFTKMATQNQMLQDKMAKCVIKNKEILSVRVPLLSAYFMFAENENDLKNRFESVKTELNNKYLPLFKERKTKEEIAKETNINNYDVESGPANAVSDEDLGYMAYLFSHNSEIIYSNDASRDYSGEEAKKMGEILAKLNNVGDYTEVEVSSNGYVGIYRLESVSGEFDNWDKFLESYKNKYIRKSFFAILNYQLFNIAYGVEYPENGDQNVLAPFLRREGNNSTFKYQSNFHRNNPEYIVYGKRVSSRIDCGAGYGYLDDNASNYGGRLRSNNHLVRYAFEAVDQNGRKVSGVEVELDQTFIDSVLDSSYAGYGFQKWQCKLKTTDITNNSGVAYGVANCFTYVPKLKVKAPKGYKFKRAVGGGSKDGVMGADNVVSPNGAYSANADYLGSGTDYGDFMRWAIGGINGKQLASIRLEFIKTEEDHPNLTVTKTASQSTAKVEDNIHYNIIVANTGNVDLPNVYVKDLVPAGDTVHLLSSDKMSWNGGIVGYDYRIPKLSAGQSITMRLNAKVKKEGTVTNRACATADYNGFRDERCSSSSVTVYRPNNFEIDAYSDVAISDSADPIRNADWKRGKTITARPGQFIFWRHEAIQRGGTTGKMAFNWQVYTDGSAKWGVNDGRQHGVESNWSAGSYTLNVHPGWILFHKSRSYDGNGNRSINTLGATENYTWYKNEDWGGARGISYEDVGKTICQNFWYMFDATGAPGGGHKREGATRKACVKVVNDWRLGAETKIKTEGGPYVDASMINARTGQKLIWEHKISNNTDYVAPGYPNAISGEWTKRGYQAYGHHMIYGWTGSYSSLPGSNSYAQPGVKWISKTQGLNKPNIAPRSSITYDSNDTNMSSHKSNDAPNNYWVNPAQKTATSYTIKDEDVGKMFCQRSSVNRYFDDATETDHPLTSGWRCAYVPYDYELTPCVGDSAVPCGGQDVPVEKGQKRTPAPKVNRPRGNTKSVPSTYKITSWTVGYQHEATPTPTSDIKNSNGDPCATYNGTSFAGKMQNCNIVANGSGEKDFSVEANRNLNSIIQEFTVPKEARLGQRYCFSLSINNYNMNFNDNQNAQANGANQWRHSAPYCLIVVKKPKMQVWGGGVYAGGGIEASQTEIDGQIYGSWAEFDAISGGPISGFGTGSLPTSSTLAFANTTAEKGRWGSWSNSNLIDDVIQSLRARLVGDKTPGRCHVLEGSWFSLGIHNQVCNGDDTQKTVPDSRPVSDVTPGNQHVDYSSKIHFYPNADVYITKAISGTIEIANNSNFEIKYARAAEHSIIVAKNIYVHPEITFLGASLIAKNEIVTCAKPVGNTLVKDASWVNNTNCGNKLDVYGDVMAKSLKSWRTSGAEEFGNSNNSTPSERYGVGLQRMLWDKYFASNRSGSRVFTTYSKELPARF